MTASPEIPARSETLHTAGLDPSGAHERCYSMSDHEGSWADSEDRKRVEFLAEGKVQRKAIFRPTSCPKDDGIPESSGPPTKEREPQAKCCFPIHCKRPHGRKTRSGRHWELGLHVFSCHDLFSLWIRVSAWSFNHSVICERSKPWGSARGYRSLSALSSGLHIYSLVL